MVRVPYGWIFAETSIEDYPASQFSLGAGLDALHHDNDWLEGIQPHP